MDPAPPRGVKGAGRGDSSGQYSGALGGSSSERRGSRNGTGDVKGTSCRISHLYVETARAVSTDDTWRGRGGGVADCASSRQALTQTRTS